MDISATIGAADDELEEHGANSRKVRLGNVRKQVSIIELLDMLDHRALRRHVPTSPNRRAL